MLKHYSHLKVSCVCGWEPESCGPVTYWGHKFPCPFKAAPSVTNHLIQTSSTVLDWEGERERERTKEGKQRQQGDGHKEEETKIIWERVSDRERRKTEWGKRKKEHILNCIHLSGVKWLETWQDIWGEVWGAINISVLTINDRRSTMPVGFLLTQTQPNKDCTSTLHCLHFSQKDLPKMNQVSGSETSVALMALCQQHTHINIWKLLSST